MNGPVSHQRVNPAYSRPVTTCKSTDSLRESRMVKLVSIKKNCPAPPHEKQADKPLAKYNITTTRPTDSIRNGYQALDNLVASAASARPAEALDSPADQMNADGHSVKNTRSTAMNANSSAHPSIDKNSAKAAKHVSFANENSVRTFDPLEKLQSSPVSDQMNADGHSVKNTRSTAMNANSSAHPGIDKNSAKAAKHVSFANENSVRTFDPLEKLQSSPVSGGNLYDALAQEDYAQFSAGLWDAGYDNARKLRELTADLEAEGLLTADVTAILQQRSRDYIADQFSTTLTDIIVENNGSAEDALAQLSGYLENPEQMKQWIDSEILNQLNKNIVLRIGKQLGLTSTPRTEMKAAIADLLLEDITEILDIRGKLIIRDELPPEEMTRL